jgi:hypothetical protein
VGGRGEGGASGGRGGCECLVKSLANHFRCAYAYACMYVGVSSVCGANPYIIIHDPNHTQTDMMTLPGGQGHGHRTPYTARTTVVPFRTAVPCRGQILWETRTTLIGCVPTNNALVVGSHNAGNTAQPHPPRSNSGTWATGCGNNGIRNKRGDRMTLPGRIKGATWAPREQRRVQQPNDFRWRKWVHFATWSPTK